MYLGSVKHNLVEIIQKCYVQSNFTEFTKMLEILEIFVTSFILMQSVLIAFFFLIC